MNLLIFILLNIEHIKTEYFKDEGVTMTPQSVKILEKPENITSKADIYISLFLKTTHDTSVATTVNTFKPNLHETSTENFTEFSFTDDQISNDSNLDTSNLDDRNIYAIKTEGENHSKVSDDENISIVTTSGVIDAEQNEQSHSADNISTNETAVTEELTLATHAIITGENQFKFINDQDITKYDINITSQHDFVIIVDVTDKINSDNYVNATVKDVTDSVNDFNHITFTPSNGELFSNIDTNLDYNDESANDVIQKPIKETDFETINKESGKNTQIPYNNIASIDDKTPDNVFDVGNASPFYLNTKSDSFGAEEAVENFSSEISDKMVTESKNYEEINNISDINDAITDKVELDNLLQVTTALAPAYTDLVSDDKSIGNIVLQNKISDALQLVKNSTNSINNEVWISSTPKLMKDDTGDILKTTAINEIITGGVLDSKSNNVGYHSSDSNNTRYDISILGKNYKDLENTNGDAGSNHNENSADSETKFIKDDMGNNSKTTIIDNTTSTRYGSSDFDENYKDLEGINRQNDASSNSDENGTYFDRNSKHNNTRYASFGFDENYKDLEGINRQNDASSNSDENGTDFEAKFTKDDIGNISKTINDVIRFDDLHSKPNNTRNNSPTLDENYIDLDNMNTHSDSASNDNENVTGYETKFVIVDFGNFPSIPTINNTATTNFIDSKSNTDRYDKEDFNAQSQIPDSIQLIKSTRSINDEIGTHSKTTSMNGGIGNVSKITSIHETVRTNGQNFMEDITTVTKSLSNKINVKEYTINNNIYNETNIGVDSEYTTETSSGNEENIYSHTSPDVYLTKETDEPIFDDINNHFNMEGINTIIPENVDLSNNQNNSSNHTYSTEMYTASESPLISAFEAIDLDINVELQNSSKTFKAFSESMESKTYETTFIIGHESNLNEINEDVSKQNNSETKASEIFSNYVLVTTNKFGLENKETNSALEMVNIKDFNQSSNKKFDGGNKDFKNVVFSAETKFNLNISNETVSIVFEDNTRETLNKIEISTKYNTVSSGTEECTTDPSFSNNIIKDSEITTINKVYNRSDQEINVMDFMNNIDDNKQSTINDYHDIYKTSNEGNSIIDNSVNNSNDHKTIATQTITLKNVKSSTNNLDSISNTPGVINIDLSTIHLSENDSNSDKHKITSSVTVAYDTGDNLNKDMPRSKNSFANNRIDNFEISHGPSSISTNYIQTYNDEKKFSKPNIKAPIEGVSKSYFEKDDFRINLEETVANSTSKVINIAGNINTDSNDLTITKGDSEATTPKTIFHAAINRIDLVGDNVDTTRQSGIYNINKTEENVGRFFTDHVTQSTNNYLVSRQTNLDVNYDQDDGDENITDHSDHSNSAQMYGAVDVNYSTPEIAIIGIDNDGYISKGEKKGETKYNTNITTPNADANDTESFADNISQNTSNYYRASTQANFGERKDNNEKFLDTIGVNKQNFSISNRNNETAPIDDQNHGNTELINTTDGINNITYEISKVSGIVTENKDNIIDAEIVTAIDNLLASKYNFLDTSSVKTTVFATTSRPTIQVIFEENNVEIYRPNNVDFSEDMSIANKNEEAIEQAYEKHIINENKEENNRNNFEKSSMPDFQNKDVANYNLITTRRDIIKVVEESDESFVKIREEDTIKDHVTYNNEIYNNEDITGISSTIKMEPIQENILFTSFNTITTPSENILQTGTTYTGNIKNEESVSIDSDSNKYDYSNLDYFKTHVNIDEDQTHVLNQEEFQLASDQTTSQDNLSPVANVKISSIVEASATSVDIGKEIPIIPTESYISNTEDEVYTTSNIVTDVQIQLTSTENNSEAAMIIVNGDTISNFNDENQSIFEENNSQIYTSTFAAGIEDNPSGFTNKEEYSEKVYEKSLISNNTNVYQKFSTSEYHNANVDDLSKPTTIDDDITKAVEELKVIVENQQAPSNEGIVNDPPINEDISSEKSDPTKVDIEPERENPVTFTNTDALTNSSKSIHFDTSTKNSIENTYSTKFDNKSNLDYSAFHKSPHTDNQIQLLNHEFPLATEQSILDINSGVQDSESIEKTRNELYANENITQTLQIQTSSSAENKSSVIFEELSTESYINHIPLSQIDININIISTKGNQNEEEIVKSNEYYMEVDDRHPIPNILEYFNKDSTENPSTEELTYSHSRQYNAIVMDMSFNKYNESKDTIKANVTSNNRNTETESISFDESSLKPVLDSSTTITELSENSSGIKKVSIYEIIANNYENVVNTSNIVKIDSTPAEISLDYDIENKSTSSSFGDVISEHLLTKTTTIFDVSSSKQSHIFLPNFDDDFASVTPAPTEDSLIFSISNISDGLHSNSVENRTSEMFSSELSMANISETTVSFLTGINLSSFFVNLTNSSVNTFDPLPNSVTVNSDIFPEGTINSESVLTPEEMGWSSDANSTTSPSSENLIQSTISNLTYFNSISTSSFKHPEIDRAEQFAVKFDNDSMIEASWILKNTMDNIGTLTSFYMNSSTENSLEFSNSTGAITPASFVYDIDTLMDDVVNKSETLVSRFNSNLNTTVSSILDSIQDGLEIDIFNAEISVRGNTTNSTAPELIDSFATNAKESISNIPEMLATDFIFEGIITPSNESQTKPNSYDTLRNSTTVKPSVGKLNIENSKSSYSPTEIPQTTILNNIEEVSTINVNAGSATVMLPNLQIYSSQSDNTASRYSTITQKQPHLENIGGVHLVSNPNSDISDISQVENSYKNPSSNVEFVCESEGKFPDPKNCSVYHICMKIFTKFAHVPLTCPRGMLYDSETRKCTRKPVHCPSDVTLSCTTSGTFPHPTYCNRYYKCFWRPLRNEFVLWQFRCPPHMKYDPERRYCVKKTLLAGCGGALEADTEEDEETPFSCEEMGRFPVEYNCRDYYECKEKKGSFQMKLKTCSIGKLYDRDWERCRSSDLVFCPFETSNIYSSGDEGFREFDED